MNTQNNTPASRNEEAVAAERIVIGYTWTQFNGKHRSIGACPTEHAYNIEPVYYPLAAPGAAIDAREQGMVSVDLYLKLADAMGYDSGKDGMEFSPEEWAAALLKDALAHRTAPSEALSPATVAQPVTWRDMATAPKDGTLLRLLVEFEHHATEDAAGPQPTIGSNTWDNHHDFDEWQFAGWSWEQDCYTQGVGKPVGWLPMLDDAAQPCASQGCGRATKAREANSPLTAWAIELLVAAGHVSREKADEAYRIACETFARERAALSSAKSGGA